MEVRKQEKMVRLMVPKSPEDEEGRERRSRMKGKLVLQRQPTKQPKLRPPMMLRRPQQQRLNQLKLQQKLSLRLQHQPSRLKLQHQVSLLKQLQVRQLRTMNQLLLRCVRLTAELRQLRRQHPLRRQLLQLKRKWMQLQQSHLMKQLQSLPQRQLADDRSCCELAFAGTAVASL